MPLDMPRLRELPISIHCTLSEMFDACMTSMCWSVQDYKIDFDDEEHPIEAFKCLCKSEFCRGGRVTKKPKK